MSEYGDVSGVVGDSATLRIDRVSHPPALSLKRGGGGQVIKNRRFCSVVARALQDVHCLASRRAGHTFGLEPD